MKLSYVAATIAVCLTFAPIALAQQNGLVQNGSFETGDFTGWTASGGLVLDNPAYNTLSLFGSIYYVDYGNGPPDATLSQLITTTPGASYNISFWVNTLQGGSPPTGTGASGNHFEATFAGQTLVNVYDVSVPGWEKYQFTTTASGAASLLEFAVNNDPQATLLDDISVMQVASGVPEASTLFVGLLGLSGIGILRHLRKRAVQDANA